MKLNWHKTTGTFALSVAILLVVVASAFAGTAYSSYHYFTDGSYGYKNRAIIVTNTSGASAQTMLGSNPLVNRGAGWFGVAERLYTSGGSLIYQTGYLYNSRTTNSIQATGGNYQVPGTYYSRGLTRSWNGSAYVGHTTLSSPNQTY